MARSLGLAAYRALARRGPAQVDPQAPSRPRGELVWMHAGEPENLLAVQDLALRLIGNRPGLAVLITVPELPGQNAPVPPRRDRALIQINAPGEHPASVEAFLDHWKPDTCIWVWGGLRPNLVLESSARRCPMFLVDVDGNSFDRHKDRWLPDLTRQLLSHFSHGFARSAAGRRRLINAGMTVDTGLTATPLRAGGQVLGCNETDLTELATAMGGRPAWFASQLMEKEIPVVLAAHQRALRLSHRLLLILQPKSARQEAEIVAQAAERDMTTALWDDGQFPDDTTQLLITTNDEERGLFYRVAPVSFLGTTLFSGDGACDPLEAAALGSAILYGPKVRQFMPSYTRLAAAGAARIVNDADALGTAVSRLIAPDQAATMAHAGWEVISEGAALVDRLVELVQATLDDEWVRA